MKLYPLQDVTSVGNDDFGTFEANDDGSFDLPNEFSEILHATSFAGAKVWETEAERTQRLVDEEVKRRSDPATLLAEVEGMRADLAAAAKPKTVAELKAAEKERAAEAAAAIAEAEEAEKAEKAAAAEAKKAEAAEKAAAAKKTDDAKA
jgi:hypothetical protein